MRYIYDNDLHIHTYLSRCSKDPLQNPERILQYAKENGLKTICTTDHFWDETVQGASSWYAPQDFPHLEKIKPLPEADGIRFLFGCETELDKFLHLGISKERMEKFDFVVIPTTHFHMDGFTLSYEQLATCKARADAWVDRFNAVLNMDLPFHKIGIAHLTCSLISPKSDREKYIQILDAIKEDDLYRLFTKAADLGVGIELNADDMHFTKDEQDFVLRPYRIAKECNCKFYMGSDAHHPEELDSAKQYFERAIDLLELEETDKFILKKQ